MAGISKCAYPQCHGFPVAILEPCQAKNCKHQFHHLCQTSYEVGLGVELPMMKRCCQCLLEEYRKYKSGNNASESSAKPPSNGSESSDPNTNTEQDTDGKSDASSNHDSTKDGNKGMPPLVSAGQGLASIAEEGAPPQSTMKPQRGYMNNSIVLCPKVYLYNQFEKKLDVMEKFSYENGPFAYGKIVQVPNAKKNVTEYIVRYEKKDIIFDSDQKIEYSECCTNFPNIPVVKTLLKECVVRANKLDYRLSLNANRKKPTNKSSSSVTSASNHAASGHLSTSTNHDGSVGNDSEFIPPHGDTDSNAGNSHRSGTTLLSGILFEPQFNNEAINNIDQNTNTQDKSDDDSSISDDGSNYDLDCSAFDDGEESNEIENNMDINSREKEFTNYMSDDWNWNNWKNIDDDESITGPPENDRYNGPHGLKAGIPTSFPTILQCIFQTTALSRSLFQRLTSQSNKYARMQMKERNSLLFIGHKWKNITVPEMIRFFGIMLRISLEPRKMGGYCSYFTENPVITIGDGYSIQLRGYEPWAKDIMTLVRFKQIRSAFHPEADKSLCNDKCHQLRYLIRLFNKRAKEVFSLGANVSFDEGGIAMRSRYCPVRMYNKDKPDKFRVDFFLLADSIEYFIYHLDVYQGKNKSNIDIDNSLLHFPTTQKAVANAIVKSGIANDPNGCRYIFMDNRYACPQLFAILHASYNIRAVGTCKANRKGFASDKMNVKNNAKRGTHVRLVDDRLGMVISRWKDSKVLQVVSTIMKKGIGKVERRVGSEKIEVSCPNDIIEYQKYMGGVDRGDQHRVVGAGFANVAHFKKWYKKAFLGICDFSLLQSFTVWNMGVKSNNNNNMSRRGSNPRRREMKKWEFYAIAAEEMMTYTDETEEGTSVTGSYTGTTINAASSATFSRQHQPMSIPKNHPIKIPTCMICSMEEGVMRKVIKSGSSSRARQFSRRKKHLAMCSDPSCNIICHSCCPEESRLSKIPMFAGMSCFEIAHHKHCNGLFIEVERNGGSYTRSVNNHPVPKMVKQVYEKLLPRRSDRNTNRGRPRNNGNMQQQEQPPVQEISTILPNRNRTSSPTRRATDTADADHSVAGTHVSNITTPGIPTTTQIATSTTRITRSSTRDNTPPAGIKQASRKIITTRSRANKRRKKN